MTERPIFSPRLLFVVIAGAAGAFLLSLVLMSRKDYGTDRYGPSTYSVSALGYAGIAGLLERLGAPVIRGLPAGGAHKPDGVVILAEPKLTVLRQTGKPAVPIADKLLLILPKWNGYRDRERRGWIERAYPKSVYDARRTLGLVLGSGEVERVDEVKEWTINRIGTPPPLNGRVQLVKSDQLRPLVSTEQGILLGELRKGGRVIWVLSDPDIMANHAFTANGQGAVFAVQLLEKFRDGIGAFIFDERAHSLISRPDMSPLLLLQFPYNIILLQVLIGLAVLAWASMGRFGAPEKVAPPLVAGKAGLVTNVAHLMEFAGHEKLMISRYVETTIRDTSHELRMPGGLDQTEQIEWLRRVGKARNVKQDPVEIMRRVERLMHSQGESDVSQFAEAARDIHQWKQEILDGASRRSRNY